MKSTADSAAQQDMNLQLTEVLDNRHESGVDGATLTTDTNLQLTALLNNMHESTAGGAT
jgi:hypothetical protein